MLIAITAISILAITGLIWLFNRIMPFKICPICAGVSGTWLWILAGIYFGLLDSGSWSLIAAIAMGGSVVGIAYQIEKRLAYSASWRIRAGKLLLWKTLFIPAGFVAVYSIISLVASPSGPSLLIAFIIVMTLLVIMTLRFIREPRFRAFKGDKAVEKLEKKMKNCC